MVYFTCRQGHEVDGLTSPLKDNWWFIGAQSGVGANESQDHENGTMAKNMALWLTGTYGLYVYIRWGPQSREARWPILMCGPWHDGPNSCGSIA